MSEKLANPAPLGLMGFGMTTILLNIHNAGFSPSAPYRPWACAMAVGPDHRGIMEFKRGNTFGVTAFSPTAPSGGAWCLL